MMKPSISRFITSDACPQPRRKAAAFSTVSGDVHGEGQTSTAGTR